MMIFWSKIDPGPTRHDDISIVLLIINGGYSSASGDETLPTAMQYLKTNLPATIEIFIGYPPLTTA